MREEAAIKKWYERLVMAIVEAHGPLHVREVVQLAEHYTNKLAKRRCENRNCALCWKTVPR